MVGAREYYDLFRKVGKNETYELDCVTSECNNIRGYGDIFYKHKNILFILSTHARGKTFKVWIYEKEDILDYLNDERLEVYGITDGSPGWTETYGWVKRGNWIEYIEKYINSLKLYSIEFDEKNRVMSEEFAKQEKETERLKIEKFNGLFRTDEMVKY